MVQEYQEPRLKLTLHKFYGRYNDFFSKYNVSSKHLMADVFSFLFNHFLNTVLTTLTWLSTVSVFFVSDQCWFEMIMNMIGLNVIYWGVVDLGELWWSVVERGGATWTMKARGELLKTFFRTYMYVDEFIVYFLYIVLIYIREHESSKWIIDRWSLRKKPITSGQLWHLHIIYSM